MERKIHVKPFDFISITDCKFNETVNQHSTGWIMGNIRTENEAAYLEKSLSNDEVKVVIYDEMGKEIPIFIGVVDRIETWTENDATTMELFIKSYTQLLDVKRETYTFQDAKMKYKALAEQLLINKLYQMYQPSCAFLENENREIKDILVQYKETDWEFLKRLASHFNTVIIPEVAAQPGINFYFGICKGDTVSTLTPISYKVKKDISEYYFKTQNDLSGLTENHTLTYEVEEYNIRRLGDLIKFKGREYLIYSLERKYKNFELVNYYTIKNENGFKVPRYDNQEITGSSLDGIVLGISGDRVKAHMLVDTAQSESTAKWFTYSTIYSSPDGTGWYAMPEIGDSVRLYFPTAKEQDGYIINSVHINENRPSQRMDPDDKLLMNKHGKYVLLQPQGVYISNGDKMNIELVDDYGIIIKSDKVIEIKADKDVVLHSQKGAVSIIGAQGITLSQDKGELEIKDNIIFKGVTGVFTGVSD